MKADSQSPRSRFNGAAILFSAAVVFLSACQTVPITGRQQLLLISPQQESELGVEAYKKTLSESKLSQNAQQVAMLKRVGDRIAAAANRDDFDWEFNLIEDPTPNAWCLPGGKVAFYTGILEFTQDETGMAVVMGHEVAHAIARHGAERISSGLLTEITTAGAAAVLGGGDPTKTEAIAQAFGLGAQVGVLLPFSRKHESEADRIGLELMAKAGYDPRAAVAFWQRMGAGGGKPPEFLSTHPSDRTRIRQIESWLPEVLPLYQARNAGSR